MVFGTFLFQKNNVIEKQPFARFRNGTILEKLVFENYHLRHFLIRSLKNNKYFFLVSFD